VALFRENLAKNPILIMFMAIMTNKELKEINFDDQEGPRRGGQCIKIRKK
jgi:hypothetical protein